MTTQEQAEADRKAGIAKSEEERAAAEQVKQATPPPQPAPTATKVEAAPLAADERAYGALKLVHGLGYTAAEVATAYASLRTVPAHVRIPVLYPALVFHQTTGEERTVNTPSERAKLGAGWGNAAPKKKA